MDRRRFIQTSLGLPLSAVVGAAAQPTETGSTAHLTDRLNPKIQQAREAALAILKPTKLQLDRGLRLHSESLVFDAYGFSPRAALDGERLAQLMNAGASAIELRTCEKRWA